MDFKKVNFIALTKNITNPYTKGDEMTLCRDT